MLTLEIEFLTGVSFAAKSQKSPTNEPDWPPQPDRVFSALVAAWGTHGEPPHEKAALEWLEQQPTPVIEASEADARRVGTSFVPPNDPSGKSESLPSRRKRQPRMFPAAIPHRPSVRFNWTIEPEPHTLESLQALATDTAYVGHSASVVRCRFLLAAQPDTMLVPVPPVRGVYPGRLEELRHSYGIGERPRLGQSISVAPDTTHRVFSRSVFSDQWTLLEDAGGQCPDLRATAPVARRLRDALMSRYGSAGLAVPELISGHQPDGTPSAAPHLAIIPMADVGSYYSEGRLMGLALVLPREAGEQRLSAERDWLAGLQDMDGRIAQWRRFDQLLGEITHLDFGTCGVWRISRTIETSKRSLHPTRYLRTSTRWASVTPIVLDRFPKTKTAAERDEEVAAIIRSACANIGLPEPQSVRICKHAAVKGAPSAYPSGNAPAWTGWTLPGFLANRMLIHAVIDFPEAVQGPIILGAGRYLGLGLCIGEQA